MKSIKFFAVASAVALLGTAGLSSCKQNNTPEGPDNYDGKTAKTEFIIKIADNVAGKNDNGKKYMPGATVQINQDRASFRGMENIILIPYADAGGSPDGFPAADNSERTGKDIVSLGNISSTVSTGYGALTGDESTIIYQNVAIPLGTKNFLFYGKSNDGTVDNDALMHQYGMVVTTGLNKNTPANSAPTAISFSPKQIYSVAGTPDAATRLVACLNDIAGASYTDPSTSTTHAWSTCGVSAPGLKELYDEYVTLEAGSSKAILATLTDLYNTLERQKDTYLDGSVPMGLATAIMNKITTYTSITTETQGTGHEYQRVLAWEAIGAFDYSIFNTAATQYPASINLPDGAAVVTCSAGVFSPVTNPDKLGGTTSNASNLTLTDITRFAYPANLWYFANSTLQTATTSQKDNYDGTNDWNSILLGYDKGDVVKSNTKSVAIHDEINYGVGLLDLKIQRKNDGGIVEFEDNEGNKFNTSSGGNLKWKGVLIGGQKAVDYKFEQNSAATPYTIYDNDLPNKDAYGLVIIPNDGQAVENYTLVFSTESYPSADDAKIVYIAVELVNDLKSSFVGVNNKVIPKGGTFYLIAALDPHAGASTVSGSAPENRVFYKDYQTLVTLSLSADCLKHAYYTIPDLRSSNLELGFSVNLEWQTGLSFAIDL